MLKSTKLKALKIYATAALFVMLLTFCLTSAKPIRASNYSRLIQFIQIQDIEVPLYVFKDYVEGFDTSSHKANLEYLNSHPDLIKKIRAALEGAPLRWNLKKLRHRLLFVPEKRKEFAALYENYCKDVIRFVLSKTNFENPFYAILTLDQERPPLTPHADGVVVFLVHNLAKEFQATNIFTSQKEKKAELKLKGKIFIGDIGSYTSQVEFLDDGAVAFTRNAYSIWQNSAENPYTALMTPAEETLHVLLRPYTEKVIEEKIMGLPQKDIKTVKIIVEEQVAVEEAVAGGLTHILLPQFFRNSLPDFPSALIQEDIKSKMLQKKYRYLQCGINLIKKMGFMNFLNLYKLDPERLRQLLIDVNNSYL